jgi:myo-inositol 2-dehydrogenase/D-chiro-inositol 1-dehydrogenase
MGQIHGPNAARHPDLRLRYVVDTDTDAARQLGEPLGAGAARLKEVLQDDAIAGVIIASSTDMHLEHSIACVAAGKAVLCEKPIDLDLQRARTCRTLVASTAQPVMLGFNRRFDLNFSELLLAPVKFLRVRFP